MAKINTPLGKVYEHIHFTKANDFDEHTAWNCFSNKGRFLLGQVRWYNEWQQFCFYPGTGTLFSSSCLEGVVDFLSSINGPFV